MQQSSEEWIQAIRLGAPNTWFLKALESSGMQMKLEWNHDKNFFIRQK